MICLFCGTENTENNDKNAFCKKCGAKIRVEIGEVKEEDFVVIKKEKDNSYDENNKKNESNNLIERKYSFLRFYSVFLLIGSFICLLAALIELPEAKYDGFIKFSCTLASFFCLIFLSKVIIFFLDMEENQRKLIKIQLELLEKKIKVG